MKKILLVLPLSTLDWGSKNSGGVDSVCQNIVRYLAERDNSDFKYRVLAFDPFNKAEFTGQVISLSSSVEIIICPTKERRLGLSLPSFLSAPLRVLEQVKEFEPEAVHSHISCWLIGVPSKYKRIATIHSYKKIGRRPVSFANDLIYESFLSRIANFFVDQYTCVGHVLVEAINRDTAKLPVLISNPVDGSYINLQRGINVSERINLVTCALITRRKRIHLAIKLAGKLISQGKQVKLTVIGPAVDCEYFKELQDTCRDFDIVQAVHFAGALSKEEILTEYQQADIGVFFSEEETFGLAPLEMIATGMPLITTSVGVIKEQKSKFDITGIEVITGDDLSSCTNKVLRLLTADTSGLKALIADNFSVESIVEKYESLYSQ